MNELSTQLSELWPLATYFVVVVLLVLFILALSHFLGQRHNEPATGEPFESGVVHVGSAQIRFSAPYFLIAMLFVIFDLEAAFIYAWAVAFREVGWPGYIEMLIFIIILGLALAYLWLLGALDWGPQGRSPKREAPLQGESAVLQGKPAPIRPANDCSSNHSQPE
ncbi:MAG: NADH-quinone oxidoreductase subunit A [Motiliproteus sp.]